jgi:hypothetical protein
MEKDRGVHSSSRGPTAATNTWGWYPECESERNIAMGFDTLADLLDLFFPVFASIEPSRLEGLVGYQRLI